MQGLAGLAFAAVATSNQKTADASAKAFDVSSASGSGLDLYATATSTSSRSRRPRSTFDRLFASEPSRRRRSTLDRSRRPAPPETPSSLEVVDEAGTIRLDGGDARGVRAGRPTVSENGHRLRVDECELATMPDAAVNVAGLYATLRDDIVEDRFFAPAGIASVDDDVAAFVVPGTVSRLDPTSTSVPIVERRRTGQTGVS